MQMSMYRPDLLLGSRSILQASPRVDRWADSSSNFMQYWPFMEVWVFLSKDQSDKSLNPAGAFILGYAGMVSADQIDDCLERGWIVVALEHRLCPQVDIFEGPVADCRDALEWVYSGGLDKDLHAHQDTSTYAVDDDRVVAFGTSSGGLLALALVSPHPIASSRSCP